MNTRSLLSGKAVFFANIKSVLGLNNRDGQSWRVCLQHRLVALLLLFSFPISAQQEASTAPASYAGEPVVSAVPLMLGLIVLLVIGLVWGSISYKALQEQFKDQRQALRQKEKDLSIAKRSARVAHQAKRDFLSSMSHELRTPLNAILGMSQLALDSGLDGKQRRYIQRVIGSANSLLESVNEVLDFTNVRAGNLHIEWVECNLETILTPVAKTLGERAQDKDLLFCLNLDMSLPKIIDADSVRLTQVLMALGDNAVKFTEEGEVSLSVSLESCRESDVKIRFSIRDSGVGIRRKELENMFVPFSQRDTSMSREHGGRGLGLSLARELVSLMGGELQADSRYGDGSVFVFTLPCQSGLRESSRLGGAWARALATKTILVISPRKLLRSNIKEPLIYAGANVSQCADTTDIKQCQSSIERGVFEHIVVDWEYAPPEMKSELSRLFSTLARTQSVVLLCNKKHGFDIPEVRPDFAFQWLAMPVMPSTLMQALMGEVRLQTPIRRRQENGGEADVDDSARDELAVIDKTVLLVEDNLINQEVALGAMETLPVSVLVANNGAEAIEMVKQHPVDIVLMDLQMPVVDGITATKVIREELGMTTLPILAMTANTDAHDVAACREAGMNEHLSKPIDFELLRTKLTEWLSSEAVATVPALPAQPDVSCALADESAAHIDEEQVREAQQPEPQSESSEQDIECADAADTPPQSEPESAREGDSTEAEQTRRRVNMEYDDTMFDLMVDNVPGINLGEGVQRLGGNKAKYLKILSLFLTSQKAAMEQLLSDIDNGDKAILAHSCKGAGSNIGADGIAKVASALEDKYNAGETVSDDEVKALQDLILSAIEKFDEIAASAETAAPAPVVQEEIKPLDAYLVAQINALQTSLQEFDVEVQDKLTSLAKSLPQWCNQLEEFKRLQESVNQFDFLTAEEHLKALKKKTG